jgi:hypothetical protein
MAAVLFVPPYGQQSEWKTPVPTRDAPILLTRPSSALLFTLQQRIALGPRLRSRNRSLSCSFVVPEASV